MLLSREVLRGHFFLLSQSLASFSFGWDVITLAIKHRQECIVVAFSIRSSGAAILSGQTCMACLGACRELAREAFFFFFQEYESARSALRPLLFFF